MKKTHLSIALVCALSHGLLAVDETLKDDNLSPLRQWSEKIWNIEEPPKPAPKELPSSPPTPTQTPATTEILRRESESRLFPIEDKEPIKKAPQSAVPEAEEWETAGQLPGTEAPKEEPKQEKGVTKAIQQAVVPSDKTQSTRTETIANPTQKGESKVVATTLSKKSGSSERTLLVNFNDVNIVEYIRFISRVSNRNFLFNEEDLQFNVTIMSEEPTTVENMISALLQVLRVHGLSMIEEGNNLVIHRNPEIKSPARIVTDENEGEGFSNSELVTRVYKLNTLSPEGVAEMIRPMLSPTSIVEVLTNSNHIIVTDFSTNVALISQLIKNVDSPTSGLTFGQYVVEVATVDSLMSLTKQIMTPIAKDQPILFVPNVATNSIIVIASPYLVEKTLAVMLNLDQAQGETRLYNLKDLQYLKESRGAGEGWELDENGNWIYRSKEKGNLPNGRWYLDENGNWIFVPDGQTPRAGLRSGTGPKGRWQQDANGNWIYQLSPGEIPFTERLKPKVEHELELPLGHIERTKFYIHKLQFRPGEEIQKALQNIAESLQQNGISNEDLIGTIHSTQWIETSNSLVFTGTPRSLDKVQTLIQEIDTPLRQVFIEMLILSTTIDDSLEYGVNFATRFSQDNASGAQAFLDNSTSPVTSAITGSGLPTGAGDNADASILSGARGYNLGIVGSVLTKSGNRFNNIAALVRAVRDDTESRIILNPKIIVEDGVQAEIFVGINTRFQTDSIANDFGTTITSNFEYQDVGTTLKVTPHLGHDNIVVLDIEQSQSAVIPVPTSDPQAREQQANAPTTSQSRTITKAHVPDRYFLILSGMMEDDTVEQKVHVPCLGGIPIISGGFSNNLKTTKKRNTMIFIRPEIIDTEEQVRNLTRHQQKIWKYKDISKDDWQYETEEFLDFLKLTDPNPCDKVRTQY